MNISKIKLLPHWCLTSQLPAFHDVESLTAVQMVARLYGSMEELQTEYNKCVDLINQTITDFVNDVNADQECFEAKITKIVHDYIITIDAKIEHQDREIAEAIDYMKNNLTTAIQDVVNQMIESGEFTEALTGALEEISTKLNTIEVKVTANETDITDLKSRISTNETDITDLKSRTTTNETDITDLKSRTSANETNITNINNKFNYSLEEQLIGTWIDGKPLYRKVIEVPYINVDTTWTSEVFTNISKVINLYGISDVGNNGAMLPLPIVNTSNTDYQTMLSFENNSIYIITGKSRVVANGYVFIEYTKTTD